MTLEELNRTSPFHAGAENTAFAPYFDGTSYLNMLSTEQVPVAASRSRRAAATTGTSTAPPAAAGKFCLLPLDGGGIRSGAKLPGRSVPATW